MRRRRKGERGAALLTVLLLVAVIAVMAATALERLRLSTRIAANAVAIDRARGYAYAAETLATTRVTALLRQSPDRVALIGGWSGRPFGLPVPGGTATARVTDGGNCFNLNGLVARAPDGSYAANPFQITRFARLARVLRLSEGERIAAATADFIDSDDVALAQGAEDASYRGRRTAGTLLADPSELRAVAGVDAPSYAALRPWLCTLPLAEPSSINVNTLLPEQAPLLAMLMPDGVGPEQVRALLLRRPETGYASTDAFWNQLSLGGAGTAAFDARQQTSVKTSWFRLAVDVVAEGAELHETALIDARRLPVRLASRQWGDAP
ncbi:type II secretion system minor pseudopilin GspK [Sphingomonas corticis]|jgi:general secretion pathway protein K|uniref:Type II secretion system protein K n=1 Tax=Sphingomonas corticis TaxID=2722791 RepID=A0ABX1CK98_9SPHN|nr:type II secretion system minor pseudopilin GspK [Sphingomonas corticis]NJR78328.1 type II secretion system minor pseudopilin GspK [Sphingomonas corticis]